MPGRRASAGPVFIIQHALYFGLGARLITAYSAQGGTRHHLTLPQTVGCYLDFRQGGRGSCHCLGVWRASSVYPDIGSSPTHPGSISVGKWKSLPNLAQYPKALAITEPAHRIHLPPQQPTPHQQREASRKKLNETKPLWTSASQVDFSTCLMGSKVGGF